VAVLILEFGTFGKQTFANVHEFVALLDPFLRSLPSHFRYAVEVRNQEFLAAEYFACLRNHGVAHVFNAWTRMPDIAEQAQLPEVFTADFTVARGLLRKGCPYEEAVAKFAPYQQVREPNHEVRQALKDLIKRARDRAEPPTSSSTIAWSAIEKLRNDPSVPANLVKMPLAFERGDQVRKRGAITTAYTVG
jgi:Protein of unknown function DUF72